MSDAERFAPGSLAALVFCLAEPFLGAQGTLVDETPHFALTALGRMGAVTAGLRNEIAVAWKMNDDGSRVIVGFHGGRVMLWDTSSSPPVLLRNLLLRNRTATWKGTRYQHWVNALGPEVSAVGFAGKVAFAVNHSGAFRTFDEATGNDGVTWDVPTAVTAASLGNGGATVALGTPMGGIMTYALGDSGPALLKTIRPEDSKEHPIGVLVIHDADDSLYSCMQDYVPSHDVANGGEIENGGPTLWTLSTGVRRYRFGRPRGTVELLRGGPGSEAILAAGGCRQFAQVDLATGTVSDYAGEALGMFTSVMNRDAPGGGCLVSGVGGHIAIHRLPPASGIFSRFTLRAFRENLIGPAAAGGAFKFAMIGLNGGVFVYGVQPRSGAPIVKPMKVKLGRHFDTTLTVTRKLIGHSNPVVEVRTSDDGAYVATRDSNGVILLWTRAADGKFSAQVMPVRGTTSYGDEPAILDFWGRTLHVLGGDAKLYLFSLPHDDQDDGNTVVPLLDGKPTRLITFRRVASSVGIVSAPSGKLYKIELPSGNLSSEIAGPEQRALNGPFGELVGDPACGRLVAIPLRKHSRGKKFVVLDTKSFSLLGEFGGFTTTTRLAVCGDKAFLSDRDSIRVVSHLFSDPTVTAREPGIESPALVALSDDVVLGFSKIGFLRLAKDVGSKRIRTTPIFWSAGSVRSCCRANSAPYVFFGTSTGKVIELTVTR